MMRVFFLIVVNHVIDLHLLFLDHLCSLKLIKSMLLFCTCMIQKIVHFSRFADDGRIIRNIFK